MNTLTKSLAVAFATALTLSVASISAWSQTGAKGGAADLVALPKAAKVQSSHSMAGMPANCPMMSQKAMNCSDCRTVAKTTTVTEGKGNVTKTLPVTEHLCPDCKTTWQVTGHGKAKTMVATYTCQKMEAKAGGCCVK